MKRVCFIVIAISLAIINISFAEEISIPLQQGWNLINSPLDLEDHSITGIIDPMLEKVKSMWKWDNYIWSVFIPNVYKASLESYVTSKGFDLFYSLNAGEGFWVNATESTVLEISGDYPEDGSLKITSPGWNLLG